MLPEAVRLLIKRRLADEVGRIDRQAPRRIALVYPSPYTVAMSSLGYQSIYRTLQTLPDTMCERAFLPDGADRPGAIMERLVTYEGLSELGEFPVLAFSVAYELEIAGLVRVLDASGIPAERTERDEHAPFVLAGGPLTFSNPATLSPYADAIVMGEAEDIVPFVVETLWSAPNRAEALAALSKHPHVYVPEHHGATPPPIARCDDALLPARSAIRTPNTELSNMFLTEVERGCSRGCAYCVMRRSTNGGMRIVPPDVVLDGIPRDVRRVGLVGAAVSDHPKIIDIVHALADRGAEVGLSSLRPDRLKDEFIAALKRAGYRTLTTALDGPSERLRELIERRGREPHYIAAAEGVKKHGLDRLKLYLMIGLPGETDADIDECARFIRELSSIVPIVLSIAPFCAKRHTPLDRMPFAGVRTVLDRLDRLKRGLRGAADVRSTSARWAWVEYVLSQGGPEEGRAVARAVRSGGRFADYRREFAELGHDPNRTSTAEMPERRSRRQLVVAG